MEKERVEEGILRCVSDALSISAKEISMDTKRDDIPEWDSLGHIMIFMALEEKFNIKFSTGEIEKLDSLRDIYNKIKEKRLFGV